MLSFRTLYQLELIDNDLVFNLQLKIQSAIQSTIFPNIKIVVH